MPSLTLRFDSTDRPIVLVEGKPGIPLQPAFRMHPPNTVPSFKEDFLVDTGATGCWVEEDLIASWHLMKNLPILTRSGLRPVVSGYAYPLALRLLEQRQQHSWYHPSIPVGTVPNNHFGGGIRGLIGMDVLRKGALLIDGPKGVFELNWQ